MYYNNTNKCILIISAYFLAAASDKRMRLLTSRFARGRLEKMTCYFDDCICHELQL